MSGMQGGMLLVRFKGRGIGRGRVKCIDRGRDRGGVIGIVGGIDICRDIGRQ